MTERILRVSEATWHRMRCKGKTPSPAIVIRGRRHYRPEVIEAWLRQNENPEARHRDDLPREDA